MSQFVSESDTSERLVKFTKLFDIMRRPPLSNAAAADQRLVMLSVFLEGR